jgi:mRNA interferase MazF
VVIAQGEVYFIDLGIPFGSEPGYPRPWVVVQSDALNASQLKTVVAAAITSNMARAGARGNVALQPGEGGLTSGSVVLGFNLYTLDRRRFEQPMGKLSPGRIRQVIDAINFVIEPRSIPGRS